MGTQLVLQCISTKTTSTKNINCFVTYRRLSSFMCITVERVAQKADMLGDKTPQKWLCSNTHTLFLVAERFDELNNSHASSKNTFSMCDRDENNGKLSPGLT